MGRGNMMRSTGARLVRTRHASYLAGIFAATATALSPAGATERIALTINHDNTVPSPVRNPFFFSDKEHDITIIGTNAADITSTGAAIALGILDRADHTDNLYFYPSITYRNTGTLNVTVRDTIGIAELLQNKGASLGSVGRNGADGGHHATRSGGPGSPGGNAGSVAFTNTGHITIQGRITGLAALFAADLPATAPVGILGLSQGGAGGHGGHAGSFGHGGRGGRGGEAGRVSVTNGEAGQLNASSITTYPAFAAGLVAISVGGVGGSAGGGSGFASGNDGGIGGNGGVAEATNYGRIVTHGYTAAGIIALSQGGGGGDGSGGGVLRHGGGGEGGQGNTASTASAINAGSVLTIGEDAPGMVVSSVGGNGGDGGSQKSLFVALGATGGHGGNGALATGEVSGEILTSGARATGLHVHSVGGGGGRGGNAHAAGLSDTFAVGGAGGGGGNAGVVTVDLKAGAVVHTLGRDAAGILAQSVGGGGGAAGSATSIAVGVAVSAASAIGGLGGDGGNGSTVTVTTLAGSAITTGRASQVSSAGLCTTGCDDAPAELRISGTHAYGILAQSVGGGGGHGGRAFAVSVAGGGDTPAAAFDMTVGGNGGNAGHGDVVKVTSAASIRTHAMRADGIVAQSIGGGGGSGGDTLGVAAASSPEGAIAIGVNLGGKGGGGGNAANAGVTNTGSIATLSSHAAGIVAQSVGGGGGNGGSVTSIEASAGSRTGNASVDLGGKAGSGGRGATAEIIQNGTITTFGHQSIGAIAQSIGGGGGNGGAVHDYSISVATGNAAAKKGGLNINLGVDLGGKGGGGGNGGVGTMTYGGTITTTGDLSHGAVVQSIGGGGGNGGSVFSLSIAAALSRSSQGGGDPGADQVNAHVSVGGKGGAGGKGDRAEFVATSGSSITTLGDHADAVLVQSVGGGGGNGGGAKSLSVTTIVPTNGSDVQNEMKKSLLGNLFGYTTGAYAKPADSMGIPGHSLSLTADVGGNGGNGSTGGAVKVTLARDSALTTFGTLSHGVLAQSIGGGGGRGGAATTDAYSPVATYTGSATVGGSGGFGNTGGSVTVADMMGSAADATITTNGGGAHGIFAQSVGGGGGAGGLATDKAFSLPLVSKSSLVVSVGGKGGAGGDGGSVSVTREAPVQTFGVHAFGILAQSIGAGGGASHLVGNAQVKGLVSLSMGGQSSNGGAGGAVAVAGGGTIATQGAGSHAIVAQSIGGGGGIATHANSGISAPQIREGQVLPSASYNITNLDGMNQGSGGTVNVTRTGSITTGGNHAFGVFAQSVGGGGGHFSAANTTFSTDSTTVVALKAQDSGRGGDITVTDVPPALTPTHVIFATDDGSARAGLGGEVRSSGLGITTRGIGAHGIFAQSIGGAGGLLAIDADIAVPAIGFTEALRRHSDYHAGAISIRSTGSITTTGDFASGIVAHSGSAGAMFVATNRGLAWRNGLPTGDDNPNARYDPGAIDITKTGNITTAGRQAHGILVIGDTGGSSTAAGPHGAPALTSTIGLTIGGSTGFGDRALIRTTGPDASALKIVNGQIGSSASARQTVLVTIGLTGSLDLSGNPNTASVIDIENHRGTSMVQIGGSVTGGDPHGLDPARAALRLSGGGAVEILAGGAVTGALVGGGTNSLTIGGNLSGGVSGFSGYTLSAGGTHYIPVDYTPGRRVVDIGGAPAIAGQIRPILVRFGTLSSAAGQEYTLLHAFGNLQTAAAAVQDTPVTKFGTKVQNGGIVGNSLILSSTAVSFSNAPIDPSLQPVARRADNAVAALADKGAAAPADDPINKQLLAAANSPNIADVNNVLRALDSSGNSPAVDAEWKALSSALGRALSCGTAQGSLAPIREGECSWASAIGAIVRDSGVRGITRDAGLSFGGQRAISPNWRAGLSFGYEASNLRSRDLQSQGHRLHLGGTLKYSHGGWLAAFGLTGAYAWSEASRVLALPTGTQRAESDRRALTIAGRARLAQLFEFGALHLMPLVDIDALYLRSAGYRERNAGAFNAQVRGSNTFMLDIQPALRLGADIAGAGGVVFRPYVEGGVRFTTTSGSSAVRLHQSTLFADPVRIRHTRDRVFATAGAGLAYFTGKGLEIRAGYTGAFSKTTQSHAGTLKFSLGF